MTSKIKLKIFRFYNTLKFSLKSYSYLTTLFNLERKVLNNIELSDEEYFQVKYFTDKVPEVNKFYIDIGAGDGVNGSCTLKLAMNDNWKGIAIDRGRPIYSNFIYRKTEDIIFMQNTVTPKNIDNIFKSYSVNKNFGFLNLDIDSYDYEVLEAILLSGYEPIVISVEINEAIPPPIEFYVKFDGVKIPELMVDHFFGCSLTSVNKLLKRYKYNLAKVYGNNAIFILKSFLLVDNKDEIQAYMDGYINLQNRDKIFPYNKELEHILSKSYDEKLAFFKDRFQKKESNYFLS